MKNIIVIIVLALVIIPIIILYQTYHAQSPSHGTIKSSITIDGHILKIETAKTYDQKTKGLSGRQSIGQDTGMLFLFDKPDMYTFWMKGMKFPLDIIWIYKNTIVTIADNLQPAVDTNPLTIPRFKPVLPADTVLEVNAGTAKKYNFKVGDKVTTSL